MNMNRKYSGFTLVEMLIVMGIVIILMAVGIAAGRFAINRANDVTHKNAVDQIVTSLQAYYTDEREYPTDNNCGDSESSGTGTCTVAELVGDMDGGGLVPYIDKGSFDGGSKATYYYAVGGDGGNQAFLVCVTLRGIAEDMFAGPDTRSDAAVYCNGTGLGESTIFGGAVTSKDITADDTGAWEAIEDASGVDWDKGWPGTAGGEA